MSVIQEENYEVRNFKYQIIEGKIVSMASLANPNHSSISGDIYFAFKQYFRLKNNKKCKVYIDNNYIRLDIISKQRNITLPEECKNDRFIPDVMVICDKSMDTMKGVTGAPTLVVEVLSKGTAEYDTQIKKQVYELIGVGEYWIVHPGLKSIEIYVLQDGKYVLYKTYYKYSEDEIANIEDERRDIGKSFEVITEFSPYTFPDLSIKIDEIFDDMIEEN